MVQIVSTVAIVSPSLNAEASTLAHLVVSSLPPGSGPLDVAVDRALRKTAKGLCAPGSGLEALASSAGARRVHAGSRSGVDP
jgi:hypothetical protein